MTWNEIEHLHTSIYTDDADHYKLFDAIEWRAEVCNKASPITTDMLHETSLLCASIAILMTRTGRDSEIGELISLIIAQPWIEFRKEQAELVHQIVDLYFAYNRSQSQNE